MRYFILHLSILGMTVGVCADEKVPSSQQEQVPFEFDANKIPPPDTKKGEPLARVFYEYIYPADIEAGTAKLDKSQGKRLGGVIFATIATRYKKQHKIEATPAEVREFLTALQTSDDRKDNQKKPNKRVLKVRKRFAERHIVQWKFDRALFKKYGGTVIWQQFNPTEPVGAYRQFLEDMEQAKVFEIFDEHNRKKAYDYFTREHPFEIPPDEVSFEKPYWKRGTERKDEARGAKQK